MLLIFTFFLTVRCSIRDKLSDNPLLLAKMTSTNEHIATILHTTLVSSGIDLANSCGASSVLLRIMVKMIILPFVIICRENIVVIDIARFIIGDLSDGLLTCIFFLMPAKPRICCLIHHEVLCLDID